MIYLTCTRRIQFSAGHRVYGHENKCANLHGHNYIVLLTAQTPSLDKIGRVIDFSVLKDRVGGWIEANWDHAFLWNAADDVDCAWIFDQEVFKQMKHFPCPFNPTAEEMARYLLFNVGPSVLENTHVQLTCVEVWETENCKAEASFTSAI